MFCVLYKRVTKTNGSCASQYRKMTFLTFIISKVNVDQSSEFKSDSWIVISGLRILMIYEASLEIIPAPGTDPVHVFLTKNGKWKGVIVTLREEKFWNLIKDIVFYFKYYQRILFTCFAKILPTMVSVDVFVCSPFLSSFHFPHSLPLSWLEFQIKTFSLSGQNKPYRATRFQFQFLSISYLETLSIIAATQEHK